MPCTGWIAAYPDLYDTGEVRRKLVVSARVRVTVTEYVAPVWRRRSDGTRVHPAFPGGLADDVTYDASSKALAFMPAQVCDVSVGRARQFLPGASGGALDISAGAIWGLGREFAAKSALEREEAALRWAREMRELHREMIRAVRALPEGECLPDGAVADFERRYDSGLIASAMKYRQNIIRNMQMLSSREASP